MSIQQIVAPPARSALFLVLTVDEGDEAAAAVRDFLAGLAGLVRSVSFRIPEQQLGCVAGVGAELWDRLYEAPRPAGLHPLPVFEGEVHRAVSTPGDLLLHIRCRETGPCFELARLAIEQLSGSARVVDEVHGFKFFDERDLLGFVDGTENPAGEAAVRAVTIGREDPAYAGSSYVVVQKYLHDMEAWRALSVEEQERVIGRTKLEDIELDDEQKPANAHVALNAISDEEGRPLQILRENMPFGRVGSAEFGTYFVAYAADPGIVERMLRNMFIGDPPGNYDRILDFSRAASGALFFVPSPELLKQGPRSV
ncbi:MAG: Dyp-type peroxidase [Pseudoclavibacter sp.]|nr:Dyp-type peroxidase [Pseudoclavibacter sp.]